MSLAAEEIVERARALVGGRFRPQGRDPLVGLDCVGVVLRALEIPAALVRRNYHLRGDYRAEIQTLLSKWFWKVGEGHAGDILLFEISSEQCHLGVNCGRSFVHADALLRRVVETPMPPRWPVAATYRGRRFSQPD
jgi:hypothetical protein